MPDEPRLTPDEYLQQAGPLMSARQANPTGPLTEQQRTALSEATLALVRQLRDGRTPDEIQSQLAEQGWNPSVAQGFLALVSQLLAKMYLQRTYIFIALALVTSMLASIAIPQAVAGDFPGWAGIVSTIVAITCILGLLRNYQLYRQFRQPTSNKTFEST